MGVNASRVRSQLDKATAVVLRASGGSDLATTTTETAVSLSELNAAYWHNKEIPHGAFIVDVEVTKRVAGGTNSYKVALVVDDVSAMNNSPVTIAEYTIPAVGPFRFVVDSKTIPALDSDSDGGGKYLAVKATLAGDTYPSFNYTAHIGKSVAA